MGPRRFSFTRGLGFSSCRSTTFAKKLCSSARNRSRNARRSSQGALGDGMGAAERSASSWSEATSWSAIESSSACVWRKAHTCAVLKMNDTAAKTAQRRSVVKYDSTRDATGVLERLRTSHLGNDLHDGYQSQVARGRHVRPRGTSLSDV